jgi:hypothetical protein
LATTIAALAAAPCRFWVFHSSVRARWLAGTRSVLDAIDELGFRSTVPHSTSAYTATRGNSQHVQPTFAYSAFLDRDELPGAVPLRPFSG